MFLSIDKINYKNKSLVSYNRASEKVSCVVRHRDNDACGMRDESVLYHVNTNPLNL